MTGVEAARLYAIVGANLTGLEKGMAEAEGIVSATSRKMDSQLATFSKGASKWFKRAALGVGVLAVASAHLGLGFQKDMALIQSSAGGTARDVKVLSGQVLDLAKTAPQGPDELAKAMYHLKSLGLDNAKAMGVLKQAVRGSIAGQADLEAVTNALGGAVRTNIKGTGDYAKAMATLNAITGAGNMRMDDLTAALSTGILPAAKTAGLSLRQVGAALATMTDENVPADAAATRLRMTLSLLAAPSGIAETWLSRIGLSGIQLGHAMTGPGGLLAALRLLKTHLATIKDPAERFMIVSRAFGGGRSSAGLMMLVNNLGIVEQKYRQIGNTASHFNENVAAQQATALNKLKTAWSSVEVALISVSAVVIPPLVMLLGVIGHIANAFSGLPHWAQKLILEFGAGALAAVGLAAGLGKLILFVKATSEATNALGVAFKFLAANPVVLIIAALVAAGIAFYELYQHSETFRDGVQAVLRAVQGAVQAFVGFFTTTVPSAFRSVWADATAATNTFTGFFTTTIPNAFHMVLGWVRSNWPVIATLISGPFAPIVALATNAFGVRSALVGAFHDVQNTVSSAVGSIVSGVVSIGGQILGLWPKAWKAAHAMVTGAFDSIRDDARSVVGDVVGFFTSLPSKIGHAIVAGADQLKDAVTGLFGKLPGWARDILGIHSPSTVFMEIGRNVVHGFIHGIEGMGPALLKKAEHMATSLIGRAGGALKGAGSAVGGFFGGLFGGGGGGNTGPQGLMGTRALGQMLAAAYGWGGGGQWAALEALWQRESGWNPNARNPTSGAYGIPQALPASKMPAAAQAGDAASQIAWGLQYIMGRYGSPAAAWAHELAVGWYAKGGIFNGPRVIGVGEAGPEAVLPIARLSSLIADALKQNGGGGTGSGEPLVNIERVEMNDSLDVELAASRIGREVTLRLGAT